MGSEAMGCLFVAGDRFSAGILLCLVGLLVALFLSF
jgi:hypothetical protein